MESWMHDNVALYIKDIHSEREVRKKESSSGKP
jgi:hypothetical protein